jgi:antitoxin YefM
MTIETTYSQARAELAQLMSRVTDDREVVVVKRRDHPAVAMIAADELAGLMETAHLLRSPANAERLLAALGRARHDKVRPATDLTALRQEFGLDE